MFCEDGEVVARVVAGVANGKVTLICHKKQALDIAVAGDNRGLQILWDWFRAVCVP